jgi:hypothetical protein
MNINEFSHQWVNIMFITNGVCILVKVVITDPIETHLVLQTMIFGGVTMMI